MSSLFTYLLNYSEVPKNPVGWNFQKKGKFANHTFTIVKSDFYGVNFEERNQLFQSSARRKSSKNFGNFFFNIPIWWSSESISSCSLSIHKCPNSHPICKFSRLVKSKKISNFSMQILEGNPISMPTLSGKARLTKLCDNVITILVTDLYVTFVSMRSKCSKLLQ